MFTHVTSSKGRVGLSAKFKCVKKGCAKSFPSLNSGKFSFKNYVHPNKFTLCTNERLMCNVILSCLAALPQWKYHRLRQRHQWAHHQWASPPGYWFGCSPLTPGFHLCLPSAKKGPPVFLRSNRIFENICYFYVYLVLLYCGVAGCYK